MEKRNSKCKECGESFASEEELKKHSRSAHSEKHNGEIEEAPESSDEETAA